MCLETTRPQVGAWVCPLWEAASLADVWNESLFSTSTAARLPLFFTMLLFGVLIINYHQVAAILILCRTTGN